MSRRRRATADADPMDLLLDTVCNVFAGIMFLTLLAALLVVQRGGARLAETSSASVKEDPLDLVIQNELQTHQHSLVEAIEQAESRMDVLDPFASKIKEANYQRELRQQIEESRLRLAIIERERLRMLEQEKQFEQTQSSLTEAESKLDAELKSKSLELAEAKGRTMRIVDFRPLKDRVGNETLVMIRYGKVYFVLANSFSKDLNENDVEKRENGIYPVKESGQTVNSQADADRVAALLARRFPPDQFYVAIAVWDDSFPAFQMVRNSIEKLGYSYRTLPADDNSLFQFGNVNRPLVQ